MVRIDHCLGWDKMALATAGVQCQANADPSVNFFVLGLSHCSHNADQSRDADQARQEEMISCRKSNWQLTLEFGPRTNWYTSSQLTVRSLTATFITAIVQRFAARPAEQSDCPRAANWPSHWPHPGPSAFAGTSPAAAAALLCTL